MSLEESMCRHRLVLISWMSGINTLKATNRERSIWQNLMISSSDVILLILKDKLKFFLDLEPNLKVIC